MKKIYILLLAFSCIAIELNAQMVLNEGFESGVFNPAISFQSTGSFSSSPGIINNTDFGSTKAFSFGKSTCGSSCFDAFKTTLIVTFPEPIFIESISWKEMEIDGNWGSQGQVFLDDVVFGGAALGAMPVNSGVANSTPQLKNFSINQMVTTIKFAVNDISSASQIIIDDLQINYTLIPKIVGYEYWFNNDFANKTSVSVASTPQLMVNQTISTPGIENGVNIINFRSFDNSGRYSSVVSHLFYKTNLSENNGTPNIVAYEYWLNNDYSNAVLVNTPVQQQLNINELISMSSLSNGIHNFNIRFKDNNGSWSSVASNLFYKIEEQIVLQNVMTEYRYWFNNDFANATNFSLSSNQQINLIDNLDLKQVPKGIYEVNFQFKDTLGRWSVVLTDTIEKIALPIADFSYSAMQYCDSTIITFADNSIDGDEYLWNFGDGNTSNLENPTHTYYTPNNYQVSLTVTDTVLGTDSTIVIPIAINSLHTSSIITEIACGSYTAPDGQIYTTSGIKTAVIPNTAGCDSTITINLTVNSVDVSVTQNGIILTANSIADFYQWLDCGDGNSIINGEISQVFTATQNGSYAVQVTQNGCTDTSACYAVTTVGIIENTFSNDIIVYPNPTDGIVKVDLGETLSEFVVSLLDVNGKIIRQSTYKNTKMFELNLNVQSGIYLLTINSGNNKATIRLIKN